MPSGVSGRSVFKCDCGVITEKCNTSVRYGETTSCGCARKSNRFKHQLKGEHHPMWRGGVSSERDRFMKTKLYKDWRTSVFERDLFSCQACLVVGGELQAHHLEPYHSNKKLRLCKDNGVTLCKECHTEFHRKYSYTDFGKECFEKFRRELQRKHES